MLDQIKQRRFQRIKLGHSMNFELYCICKTDGALYHQNVCRKNKEVHLIYLTERGGEKYCFTTYIFCIVHNAYITPNTFWFYRKCLFGIPYHFYGCLLTLNDIDWAKSRQWSFRFYNFWSNCLYSRLAVSPDSKMILIWNL